MDKVYISINGDDVGQGIGNAVATDNHEELSKLSNTIKDSHDMINQWVESKGGEIITASGDEGLYSIPVEAAQELENIRDEYQKRSGNSLTIGVGSSMSEASKALIYGKLNEKNQIVEYFPEIEGHLSESDDEEIEDQIPGDEEIKERGEAQIEEEAGIPQEPEQELEQPEHEEQMLPEDNVEHDAQENEADEQDADIVEADEEIPEMEEEMSDPESQNIDPEHEREMGSEEEFEHDAQENAEDEMDADIIEADEESEEQMLPEDASPEEINAEDGGEDMEGIDELSEEDVASGSLDEEGEEEGGDNYNMLSDMIHGHLSEEDGEESEEGEVSDEDVNEELRQDIFNALQGFKNNKEALEDAKTSNPEMYQSLISMLGSLIQMARQMDYRPEEDLEEADNRQEIEDGFPHADDFESEEGVDESAQDEIEEDEINQDEEIQDEVEPEMVKKKS